MITTLLTAAAILLSLALPFFPEGLSPSILAYLALLGLAGVGGFLRSTAARKQLVLLIPWALALALAACVGLAHGNPSRQLLEDALPYLLFALGLAAGRGGHRPRALLLAALLVCLADSAISLYRMPSYDLSRVRSTYFYFRIIGGTPLVGLYIVSALPRLDRERARVRGRPPPQSKRARRLWSLLALLLVLAVVATVSRGMLLALALGVGTAVYLRRPSRGLSLAALAGLGLLLFTPALSQFGEHYLRLGSLSTVGGRMREIIHCLYVFSTRPALGLGLGAEFVVDSHVISYVHNMIAYHLWKFGLLGSALLSAPLWAMAQQAARAPHDARAAILGGAVSVLAYLVTCASYKSYTLVPLLGVVVGATLALLAELRLDAQRARLHAPAGASAP